MLRESSMY